MVTSRGLRRSVLALALALAGLGSGPSLAEELTIHAGRVLDVRGGGYLKDQAVVVKEGRIVAIEPWSEKRAGPEVVDLTRLTVLPGLIDAHTHLLSRNRAMEDYASGLVTKSLSYRTLEGAANARATLMAGFTTVRDVESEGAGFADAALRDAIADGLVPGPRMQVATRGIAAVGYYFPQDVAPEFAAILTGAQMVSGTEEMRRAVREQIRGGADLIKLYVDFRDPGGRKMHATLTLDEIRTAVEEAHRAGRRVAAHAMTPEGVRNAVAGGVDSIEHGHMVDFEALKLMAERRIALVPTAAVLFDWIAEDPKSAAVAQPRIDNLRKAIAEARRLGVRIVCGSDPALLNEHGKNARELSALTRLGLTPLEAIRAATLEAAALMELQDQVGSVEVGKRADLIAVQGDPVQDVEVLGRVLFVMKDGQVYRHDP